MADTNGPGVTTPDAKVEGNTLVIQRKAVNSADEAWKAYEGLKQDQDTRNSINGKIALRYTGQRPRDPGKLREEGRSWQSNFPTGALEGIISRIIPNFLNAVENQKYLTQATLPDQIDGLPIPDRDKKVENYRETFTKWVKCEWTEWRDFNAALVTELVLIGYDFTTYSDEDTPWPMLYRQDQAWVHEQSPQNSKNLQLFAFEQPVLIHEFVTKIQSAKKAEDSRWDLDNCAEALNRAMPLDPTRDSKDSIRAYADLVRESSTASSVMPGAKSILLGHLFAMEPEEEEGKGRVSHWILDVSTKKELFHMDRRFDTMDEVCTMFTLESGNNKFYGSRGVGKKVVNLTIGIDELVNDAVSQMKMAGMMIIQGDSKSSQAANIGYATAWWWRWSSGMSSTAGR